MSNAILNGSFPLKKGTSEKGTGTRKVAMNYPRLEEEILGGRIGPGPGWQHKKMWSGAVYISNHTWCKEEIFLKENKFSSSYI